MDEKNRAEIAEVWKRDRIRNWISILFVLALIAGLRWLTMGCCVLWLAYLFYCYRKAPDKGSRITYAVVALLPVGFFLVNLVALIRG